MNHSRGDIFLANLDPTVGREIQKTRPVIIVSNNINNEFSSTVTVVPVTSQKLNKIYPFEVLLPDNLTGLPKQSKAVASQIRTLDKRRLLKKLGLLAPDLVLKLNRAIRVHLDLI